jgi:bifunctional non-homologous end joining protein LigD
MSPTTTTQPASARQATTGREAQPQFATVQDAVITSVDWLVEPCWKGDRLLARYENGKVHLTNQHGAPAGSQLQEAAEVISDAIDAEQALIDGSWTAMPFIGQGSAARQWAQTIADETGAEEKPDPASLETRRAFVAWDLVELDGQSLRDIPYQERRRLLSSVIVENIRVRVSPAVRLPIQGWLGAWQANGFTHFVAKQVNSRYRHGETAPDWLQVSVEPEKQPSIVGRLFGQRPPKRRHVRDDPDKRKGS